MSLKSQTVQAESEEHCARRDVYGLLSKKLCIDHQRGK